MAIKKFNIEDYPDLLCQINLSSDQIVNQIANYRLTFLNVHNRTVEWGMRLPMFVPSFYGFIKEFLRVPNQDEFFRHYLDLNSAFFKSNPLDDVLFEGLKARAYRTYPSLVRDICFNKYVKEHIDNYSVLYNIDLDVVEGIDLMLSLAEKHFAINLYTQTSRAFTGRAKKQFRHTQFDNVNYIEFPVNFKGSYKVGEFFLYWQSEFINLLNQIK